MADEPQVEVSLMRRPSSRHETISDHARALHHLREVERYHMDALIEMNMTDTEIGYWAGRLAQTVGRAKRTLIDTLKEGRRP